MRPASCSNVLAAAVRRRHREQHLEERQRGSHHTSAVLSRVNEWRTSTIRRGSRRLPVVLDTTPRAGARALKVATTASDSTTPVLRAPAVTLRGRCVDDVDGVGHPVGGAATGSRNRSARSGRHAPHLLDRPRHQLAVRRTPIRSHTRSTSDSTCDERNTVVPRAAPRRAARRRPPASADRGPRSLVR